MPSLLVDGSNLWCRAYCIPRITPPGGALHITAMMLNKLVQRFGKNNVIICWDAGSGGRRQLDPSYKAQRYPEGVELDGDKDPLTGSPDTGIIGAWQNIKLVKAMVNALGIMYAATPGFEADDTIGSLAQILSQKLSGKIYIHSHDKDFYQVATTQVGILHPDKKMRGKKYPERIVHRKDVVAEFDLEPEKLPWLKAFTGDTADNIPKIPIRLTKKFKAQLLKAIKDADAFNDVFRSTFDANYARAVSDFQVRGNLNLQLLTIQTKLKPDVRRNSVNRDFLQQMCDQFQIEELKFKL